MKRGKECCLESIGYRLIGEEAVTSEMRAGA